MNQMPGPVPPGKIAHWLREAASDETWRPGRDLEPGPKSWNNDLDFHQTRVQAALERARRKTFVSLPKPFRRLMRNQGAVNDSLLEALHHLALHNAELTQEVGELRDELRSLSKQMRADTLQEAGLGEIMREGNRGEDSSA